ncbi:MAG: hypothetical protein WD063_04685 [Pirellulales bacterium]
MNVTRKPRRLQFSLRSLLAGTTWLALLVALCVGHQKATSRQRAAIERLKAAGLLPVTIINGRPVLPPVRPTRPDGKTR